MKKTLLATLLFACVNCINAQEFSLGTDVSLLRNFTEKAHFWTVGQTIQVNVAVSDKQSFYGWLNYYKAGSFHADYIATEKSSGNPPAEMPFTVNSQWRFHQFSLGWKHYFYGSYNSYTTWNVYSLVGFGIIFNSVQNNYTTPVDTAIYITDAPREGSGKANRLTFDLGLGVEYPLGGWTYIYSDIRSYIPASSTPSPYIHGSQNVPFPVLATVGMRILFGE